MVAALAHALILAAINLIAVPFYLHHLGMEALGVIGFFTTLQVVLQILEFGIGATMSREAARGTALGDAARAASMLRTLGIFYALFAVAILVAVVVSAEWIAANWLKAQQLPAPVVVQSIMLMGLNVACRWPIALYHGAIAGAQRLAVYSSVGIVASVLATVVTLAVLSNWVADVRVFFFVQALIGLGHTLVLREVALRLLGGRSARIDLSLLRGAWRFSAWMAATTVAMTLLTQADKIVLSRTITLEDYGHYMLAVMLVSSLQVLTIPAFNVIYPRFSSLCAEADMNSLEQLYSAGARLFGCVLFAAAFMLIFHADVIVDLWLRDRMLGERLAPTIAMLAAGSALFGIMCFPYALLLAAGKPKLAFVLYASLLSIMLPLTVVLSWGWGKEGGAVSWFALGVGYLAFGTWMAGRQVVCFSGWRWLTGDLGWPVLATAVAASAGAIICSVLQLGSLASLGVAAVAALAGAMLGLRLSFSGVDAEEIRRIVFGKQARLDH